VSEHPWLPAEEWVLGQHGSGGGIVGVPGIGKTAEGNIPSDGQTANRCMPSEGHPPSGEIASRDSAESPTPGRDTSDGQQAEGQAAQAETSDGHSADGDDADSDIANRQPADGPPSPILAVLDLARGDCEERVSEQLEAGFSRHYEPGVVRAT
jgi:hypothetical protein